jgi:hypothetical protein
LTTIFVDESGYTGQDLLSGQQPALVLASLSIPEETCTELKGRYFAGIKTAELKHGTMAKWGKQQQMVFDFLRALAGYTPIPLKLAVAHKKYVLMTKVVDLVVEPALSRAGISIYEGGANVALSNVLFYALPAVMGEEFFNDFLHRFQTMIRARTPEAYDRFFEPLFVKEYPAQVDSILELVRAGHEAVGLELLDGLDHSLDIAVALMFALMNKWRADVSDEIILVHDRSSAMARSRWIWDGLTSPEFPEAEVVFNEASRLKFPVALSQTLPEDSKDWAGLQLADVAAGAAAWHARWVINGENPEDAYGRQLDEVIPTLMRPAHAIWPGGMGAAETDTPGDETPGPLRRFFEQVNL